ncbi:MAG TPA: methyltransferase domain-containing protein [Cyclobacteriaceae bacterium]|nr:methyltransferase domain-containing protein [Cyclobacteriaceae bacterium]
MSRILLMAATILVCTSFQDQWKNVYIESAWKDRDRWQRADDLIRQLAVRKGSQVADIGSHEGYMTFKLSDAVGPNGKVFAVDVEQYKLDRVNEIARARNVANVTTVKGAYDDPGLAAASIDAAIILDTYHEMKEHDAVLSHILVALKPGGRLVLCEPIAENRRMLSRSEQEGKHELGIQYAIDDLARAGFSVVRKQDPFVDREREKGDKMWLIVAVKK